MKNVITIICSLFVPYAAFAEKVEGSKMELRVKVVDENGNAVPGIAIKAKRYLETDWTGQGFGKDVWEGLTITTKKDGVSKFSLEKSIRPEVRIYHQKEIKGYYQSVWMPFIFSEQKEGQWHPLNPVLTRELKTIKNPIPLCAKSFYANPTKVPQIGTKCGFDFKVGDWVRPLGNGITNDIFFDLKIHENKSVNENSYSLSISFPNEKDGLIPSPKDKKYGSALRLSHKAPEKGYLREIEMQAFADPKTRNRERGFSVDQNYFLRTRTVTDKTGKIVSANYAKVYGDFEFWIDGTLRFTYYFNPKINLRNLEFDATKNLLAGESVTEP
jgi:hypothetical protein